MITMGEDVLVRDTLKQLETPIYVGKSIQKDDKMSKNIMDMKKIMSEFDKHDFDSKKMLRSCLGFLDMKI